jgi:hypothetical protein
MVEMKASFRKALKLFKYSTILFSIVYWIYIVIDDYVFIENYWTTNWAEYLGLWTLYFLVYFLAFSFYFWLITTTIILTYHKIIKPIKDKKTNG